MTASKGSRDSFLEFPVQRYGTERTSDCFRGLFTLLIRQKARLPQAHAKFDVLWNEVLVNATFIANTLVLESRVAKSVAEHFS